MIIDLAAMFAHAGKRVLLVDADPQGSALAWSSARELPPLFPVVGMAKPTLHKDMPELSRDYDVVVIDGAPRVNELGRAAILASEKAARERKRLASGKCEGRKSHAEINPEMVHIAKGMRRRKRGNSLRAIAADLASRGYVNSNGKEFSAASVRSMLT